MTFIEATDLSDFPACAVLLPIETYEEYLTFQGPVYEQYRHYSFGSFFLHFTDEGARERWLAACNRYHDAFDEVNYRDIHGQLHCSFQRRDECAVIMQEAVEEMDACAASEKRLDFYSWPKPALTVSQLQSLVDEAFERWQRYSELLKRHPSTSDSERRSFERAEPELSERFIREEPVIWRDPLPFTIDEYLSYDLARWLWTFLRDFSEVDGKREQTSCSNTYHFVIREMPQQDSPLFPQFFSYLKLLGYELAS